MDWLYYWSYIFIYVMIYEQVKGQLANLYKFRAAHNYWYIWNSLLSTLFYTRLLRATFLIHHGNIFLSSFLTPGYIHPISRTQVENITTAVLYTRCPVGDVFACPPKGNWVLLIKNGFSINVCNIMMIYHHVKKVLLMKYIKRL